MLIKALIKPNTVITRYVRSSMSSNELSIIHHFINGTNYFMWSPGGSRRQQHFFNHCLTKAVLKNKDYTSQTYISISS